MTQAFLSLRLAFQAWFGLTATEAAIVAELYALPPDDGLPCVALAARVQTTPRALSVHLTAVRRALDTEALDYQRGRGYSLTEPGHAECRAALWQVGEELRSAA